MLSSKLESVSSASKTMQGIMERELYSFTLPNTTFIFTNLIFQRSCQYPGKADIRLSNLIFFGPLMRSCQYPRLVLIFLSFIFFLSAHARYVFGGMVFSWSICPSKLFLELFLWMVLYGYEMFFMNGNKGSKRSPL